MEQSKKKLSKEIDWAITLVPLCIIVGLSLLFFLLPEQSNNIINNIRFFLGDTMGSYYLVIGLGIFLFSIFIACSKYGKIVLGGQHEKPKYSFFAWGSMMFTAGLAADILFYSFSEWILYATDPHIAELGSIQKWASVYPIFHWSLIPWAFYLVLAVAFGFMLHVRKREKQKYSEACRPILGKHTDGILGRIIDLLAVFALLAGTATTFTLATPLMARIINELFGVQLNTTVVTIVILLVTCVVYTYSLLKGFKGIKFLANSCVWLFFGLLAFVLLFSGDAKYIIETGISSLGTMAQNFFELSTYTDPGRTTSFPQNWTIFYWAYWMVWCVAAPFFIGSISKGRTIRQTILGGYAFGVGSTILSFIILGNYSLGQQVSGAADFIAIYNETGDLYEIIVQIINTLPVAPLVLAIVLITMMMFYATSFDSIALIASCYSYKKLGQNESPSKWIQFMWCVLLILLPIALIFSESSMSNLQSVSIIAAFPIGIVMILIVASFVKDAKKHLAETTSAKAVPTIQEENAEE
ncbi:MAG: BCCT family transporter [Clostridia bacterium]|nr:BCCT family transporter [Clostridia bacterium]